MPRSLVEFEPKNLNEKSDNDDNNSWWGHLFESAKSSNRMIRQKSRNSKRECRANVPNVEITANSLTFFKIGQFSTSFFFIFIISTVNNKCVHYKILPITEFEPWTSSIGSDRSANWGATTVQLLYLTFASVEIMLVILLMVRPWSYLVEGDEGCIGASGKLLCLC